MRRRTSGFRVPTSHFVGSFSAADLRLSPLLPEIAFIGRSNVGKSSLLNALVGRRALARTSRTPGQTRACNVFAVDGRYYFVDLPGYGWARLSQVQRQRCAKLIRDYILTREAAGLIWLLDLRRDPSADDLAIAALLAERSVRALVTFTKVDQVPRGRWGEREQVILRRLGLRITSEQCMLTSARTKEGIATLRIAIERLVGETR